MAAVPNPHDKFFKAMISRPEVAKDFILYYLPKEVVDLLDGDSIILTKDSFVDQTLREQFSDLLYTAKLKKTKSKVYLYLLFEHKSAPDPLVAFQLLRYMMQIWHNDLHNLKRQKLRIIIPIVFYHGKKEWVTNTDFISLFANPGQFRNFIPNFEYVLCDTHHYNDEDIQGDWLLRVAIFSMKYIFRKEFPVKMRQILQLIKEKGEKSIPEILEIVVQYFTCTSGRVSYDDLVLEIQNTFRESCEDIMPTIAEQFIKQGKEIGREEGREEGRQAGELWGILVKSREDILDVLETRFSFYPSVLKVRLEQINDQNVLKQLLKSAVTVNSNEELLRLLD